MCFNLLVHIHQKHFFFVTMSLQNRILPGLTQVQKLAISLNYKFKLSILRNPPS